MADFTVINGHWGDKDGQRHRYAKGETRTGDASEPDIRAHLQFGNLVAAKPTKKADAPE